MANKLIIDGEVVLGSTDTASSVICKDINGNNSTVQNELDKINNNIDSNINTLNNKVPFSFGIDANGNYGYIKDGADTVIPFKKLDIKLVASNNISDDPYLNNAEIGKTYVISYYSSRDSKYTGKFTSITGCEILSSLQLVSTYKYGSVYQDLNVVFIKATSTSISSAVSSNGYTCWCIYQID